MKYLQKSFTIAVSSPDRRTKMPYADPVIEAVRLKKASTPHEFVGSVMCVVCTLDSKAKIHTEGR